MATTTAYAYERIYEVLIDGNGANRTLASSDRFVRGYPPGYSLDERATRAKLTPAIFVAFSEWSASDFAAGELTNDHIYLISVTVFRDHWLGFQGDPAEVQAQQVKADNAFLRMRAALCWPGNLVQTEGSNATGFASDALDASKATSRMVRDANLGGNDRLLQYVDKFRAVFSFAPDG